MSNDASDANADDLHTLPTQTQALYQRLLGDGASWRTTPELSDIGERLRERAQGLTLLQVRQSESATVDSLLTGGDRKVALQHQDIERHVQASPRSFPRRMSVWLATVSLLVIVGALAALLLSATRGRSPASNGSTATASAKATANATVTLLHGRWVSLDSLAASVEFDANDLPAIAPSDPHVVYQTLARGIQQHLPATLRRTDDGGATWHDLPVPVPSAHVGHAGFLVSPLDARTVFLTLIDTQAEDCPPGTAQLNTEGGGVLCWLQYTSTDSGAHWKATKLPRSGWITPNLTNNSATALQVARGSDGQPRLYALLNCPFGVTTCSRLIVSADSGLSWSYADASLLAAGATNVCSTAADSRSATVYAVTTADVECGWNRQKPLTLWRSEDAGAHWTNAGALGTPNLRGLQVAHDAATGRALLIPSRHARHKCQRIRKAANIRSSQPIPRTSRSARMAVSHGQARRTLAYLPLTCRTSTLAC